MTDEPLDLSPEARELFRVAREGARPSAEARARSIELLSPLSSSQTRGSAPLALVGRTEHVPFSRFSKKTRILLAAALVFVTAASVAAVHRLRMAPAIPVVSSHAEQAGKKPIAARGVPVPETIAPAEAPDPAPAPSSETPANIDRGTRPVAPSVVNQKGDMSDDLALLGKARQALALHRSAEALRLLAEDAQRFPNSPLREERAYSRIRALCDLGRTTDARAEAARFLRQWPASVYATGVRRSCPFANSAESANDSLTGSRSPGH